jgi:hypothetical protein
MRSYPDEQWRKIDLGSNALRYNYSISNYGRLISFTDDMTAGKLLRGGSLGGYCTFVCRPFGKSKTFYVHKLVAEYFLNKEGDDLQYVIHLDYNKKKNYFLNLLWVSKRDMELHQQKSPYVLESRAARKLVKPTKGHKLTSTDVMRIKKKIFDPKRKTRMKMIAKQFGISEMQLYRIKSGENWSHVVVDGLESARA